MSIKMDKQMVIDEASNVADFTCTRSTRRLEWINQFESHYQTYDFCYGCAKMADILVDAVDNAISSLESEGLYYFSSDVDIKLFCDSLFDKLQKEYKVQELTWK